MHRAQAYAILNKQKKRQTKKMSYLKNRHRKDDGNIFRTKEKNKCCHFFCLNIDTEYLKKILGMILQKGLLYYIFDLYFES